MAGPVQLRCGYKNLCGRPRRVTRRQRLDMTPPMETAEPDQGPCPSIWRYVRASRAHVVIDAADYYAVMQQAMKRAKQLIHMIGWDFDTRMRLART